MTQDTAPDFSIRMTHGMDEIHPQAWDACANPPSAPYDPFLSHAFLHALEASGSATAETGWAPVHLVLERGEDLLGAVPLYLKSHSYGEYIFDHGWADAFERAGGRYYPKLLSAIPFTPVTGRRFLVRDGEDHAGIRSLLLQGLTTAARQLSVSSLHVNFPVAEDWEMMGASGLLQRMDQQFHWCNKGYGDFDAFLADLASRKRKAVKKERAAALSNGITVEWITGDDLTEDHWDAFFTFYVDTGARKWGQPYLTREFFSRVGETMAKDILLILAKREGRYIAGALNFIGGDALYGRHWGCTEHHDFLHFELCYYQAIDFAIERGLARVEAGAQGAHKLARGYVPVETHSSHWIANEGFRDAVEHYLSRERKAVTAEIDALSDHAPFRKGG